MTATREAIFTRKHERYEASCTGLSRKGGRSRRGDLRRKGKPSLINFTPYAYANHSRTPQASGLPLVSSKPPLRSLKRQVRSQLALVVSFLALADQSDC